MGPRPQIIVRKTLTWRVVLTLLHVLYALFWPLRVTGRENIPSRGPGILVANHRSFLDIPLVAIGVLHRHVGFVARRSLTSGLLLRFILARAGTILVDPGTGDRAALKGMLDHLQAGGLLGVFPEGTRSLDGSLRPPKKGVSVVARKSGAAIIPCAILGTFRAWPRGRRFPKPGRLEVRFGEAIDGTRPGALEDAWDSIAAMLGEPREAPAGDPSTQDPNTGAEFNSSAHQNL